jgi:hypothetical protein
LEYFGKLHALCEEIYEKVPYIIKTEEICGKCSWHTHFSSTTIQILVRNRIHSFRCNRIRYDKESFYEVRWSPLNKEYSKTLVDVINGEKDNLYRVYISDDRSAFLNRAIYSIHISNKRMKKLSMKLIRKDDIMQCYNSNDYIYHH